MRLVHDTAEWPMGSYGGTPCQIRAQNENLLEVPPDSGRIIVDATTEE